MDHRDKRHLRKLRQQLNAHLKAEQAQAIQSPCTGLCIMHDQQKWCRGCLRTMKEITYWSSLDETAKDQVWQQVAQRLAGHTI